MNHHYRRTSSDKSGASLAFIKQSHAADRKCCPSNRTTEHHSPSKCCGKTHTHVKIKRLKSHKQRNQLRGCAKKVSKSNHCRCHHPRSTDIAHLQMCCHSSCPCPSRRLAPLPNIVPAAQEPSIITDNRLTGHQGLFNREVKSVPIDRLLSRQSEVDINKQETLTNKNVSSYPTLASLMPSPFRTNQRSAADEPLPWAKKSKSGKKSLDIYVEEEGKSVCEPDMHVTPAHRPRQQLDPSSSRSCKGTVSSNQSSLNVMAFKNRKTRSDIAKGARVYSMQNTPKNSESPIPSTRACRLSPKPVTPSSHQTQEDFNFHHRQQDPDRVSQSIQRVGARLCDGLCFPYLRQRDLVAESRDVLLKVLDKSHRHHLWENLQQLQQCFRFCSEPTSQVQDQKMSSTNTDEFLLEGTAGTKPHFYTHQVASFGKSRSSQSANSQPQHNLKQFLTYFEPPGAGAADDFFALSAPRDWTQTASTSQHWEDRFNRPNAREDLFGPFENNFLFTSTPHHLHHNHNLFNPDDKSPFEIWSHLSDMTNYPPSHMLERDSGHSLFSFPGPECWLFPPMRLF